MTFTLLDLVALVLVAALVGALAQALTGQTRGGCLVSITLGLIGAVVGTLLSRLLGLPDLVNLRIGDQAFPLVWSIIGAALFVAGLGRLTRRHASSR